jgi:predicted nucleic acid-binding protein
MRSDGVPLSSWQRVKDRFKLTKTDTETLTKDVLDFLDEFNVFAPMKNTKKVKIAPENYEFPLISKLVLEKNIRTHDAILLSVANGTGCDYFITGDKELRNLKVEWIELTSPQSFLQKLKKIEPKLKNIYKKKKYQEYAEVDW